MSQSSLEQDAAPTVNDPVDSSTPGGPSDQWHETDENVPPLGLRLRHARLARRLRLKDVAAKVPCSESLISKIERNRAAPSLRMLHRLAAVLETSIAGLLAPAPVGDEVVRRVGERPVIRLDSTVSGAHILLERLIPHRPGVLLEANIHAVEPGAESDGAIEHEGEEIGFVLEGRLQLWVDNDSYMLGPGDAFHFQSHRKHRYRNPGNALTRILWVNTPPTF